MKINKKVQNMLDGQLPKAQIAAAQAQEFIALANQDVEKGITFLMLNALPNGSHATKLSALPDFVRATIIHLGGSHAEIFNETVANMLTRVPKTKNGDEIAVVEAIRKTHNFLSHDKI